MKRDLRLEQIYPHPPDLVWRALTERELLSEWLMQNDFVAEVGARFQFRTEPQPGFDGIVRCEVLELEPPRRMRWSWKGGPLDTEVAFTLEPVVVYSTLHTKLVLEHTGFEGFRALLVSFILGSGWGNMQRVILPELLERLARGAPVEGVRAACERKHERWRLIARVVGPVLRRAGRRG